MALSVHPVSSAVGAEIRGVDLSRPLDAATFQAILDAWHAHCVLLFRDQALDSASLVAFSRRFGDLDLAPPSSATEGDISLRGFPEITVISNIVENGKPLGALGNYEAAWHTDMSYFDLPPTASILFAVETPPSGGETGFCNMYRAYETLPDDVRRKLVGKVAIHDHTLNSAGDRRAGFAPVADVTQTPGARHPMLRTHPATGRTALFLGRRQNSYVLGMPVAESEALLDFVWAHATAEHNTWHHAWRPGDLLIWDNRCAMHHRNPFDPKARRFMIRTQVKGDRPVPAAA